MPTSRRVCSINTKYTFAPKIKKTQEKANSEIKNMKQKNKMEILNIKKESEDKIKLSVNLIIKEIEKGE